MSLQPFSDFSIPETTLSVARAVFPKGNIYMTLRDEVGPIFSDHDFIDWKYLLGLELTDSGFDGSVLVEFRSRLVENSAENRLLDHFLKLCKSHGLLKSRGQQRTDSTHILAAVRSLNRLETVGETMRHALEILASVDPEWLIKNMDESWYERYEHPFEQYQLPKEKSKRQLLGEQIGQDGWLLYRTIYQDKSVHWMLKIPAVEILRQIWLQQYIIKSHSIRWRTAEESPPSAQRIQSPYDLEVRYATKRDFSWIGYKGHITETCDEDEPNLISHVETTLATTSDQEQTESIHKALDQKELLPEKHLVDAGYSEAERFVESQKKYDIELVSPAPSDNSWQAKEPQCFDISQFRIDWQKQEAICPQGELSQRWDKRYDKAGKPVIDIAFSQKVCTKCPMRKRCTKSKRNPRRLRIRPKEGHQALQKQRVYQQTEEFKTKYATRNGIEGTISLAVGPYQMRRTRYIGLRKTHLQNVVTAAAINIKRIANWIWDKPKKSTQFSKTRNMKIIYNVA